MDMDTENARSPVYAQSMCKEQSKLEVTSITNTINNRIQNEGRV